jgi:hypothetical protein
MFLGATPARDNGITKDIISDLKFSEFYLKSLEDKKHHWNKLAAHAMISCHRQFGFDFNTINPVTVISIKINDQQWLYNRVIKTHWEQLNYDLVSTNLKKIKDQLPDQHLPKLIEADYRQWERANILNTDIVLDFECVLDDRIVKWCNDQNLAVNQETLDIIRQDIKNYQ